MDKRILGRGDLTPMVGLCYATIWKLMKQGKFPQSIKLSEKRVGWRASEVEEWLESREVGSREAVNPAHRRAA